MIKDLRRAVLGFGLGVSAAIALPYLDEITERLAENLLHVGIASACLYGAAKGTRAMIWYEQGGEALSAHQSKQNLRVKTVAIAERASLKIDELKGRRSVERMKHGAAWMQELAIYVDRNIEPSLQASVRREMGVRKLGDPSEADWLDSLPMAEDLPMIAPAAQSERQLPRINEAAFAGQIPDGAKLIECSALNDIDRYPVVMVIAGQGAGKSATMGAIFERMDGLKVVASPKPLKQCLMDIYDIAFGGDLKSGRWANFGNMDREEWGDAADFSWHLHQATAHKMRGSMLRFLWAARRESMNRQLGETEQSQAWRCFYDEASWTYGSGFSDPFDPGKGHEKKAQGFVQSVTKDAFQNFRGQWVQFFVGAQNESVDSVGLKGFSANIKDAWHLYPGLSAIEAAERHGKLQLAQWFRRQVAEGQGIAMLEKNGLEFHVFSDLPTISELKRLTDPKEPNYEWKGIQPASGVTPDPWQPTQDPADLLTALKQWRKQTGTNPNDDELLTMYCRLTESDAASISNPDATVAGLRRDLGWAV